MEALSWWPRGKAFCDLPVIFLAAGEVAEDLASYLADSEQTNSALALGVSINRDTGIRAAGGFLVQVTCPCHVLGPLLYCALLHYAAGSLYVQLRVLYSRCCVHVRACYMCFVLCCAVLRFAVSADAVVCSVQQQLCCAVLN